MSRSRSECACSPPCLTERKERLWALFHLHHHSHALSSTDDGKQELEECASLTLRCTAGSKTTGDCAGCKQYVLVSGSWSCRVYSLSLSCCSPPCSTIRWSGLVPCAGRGLLVCARGILRPILSCVYHIDGLWRGKHVQCVWLIGRRARFASLSLMSHIAQIPNRVGILVTD